MSIIQNKGRPDKPRNTTFRHFPSHTHTKQNKTNKHNPLIDMVNLTGKHPKTKRKLQNPDERKRERERERELLQFYKTPQITTKQNLVLEIITSVHICI